MNIKDWQKAKKEHKGRVQKPPPTEATEGSPRVPARLDVLEAELAAIAARPLQDEENPAEKSKS